MSETKRKVCCAGIIFYSNNGRVLLEDRRNSSKHDEHWSFFGGVIEAGESKEEALKRFQIIAESDPSYSWLSTLEKYRVIELKRLAMSTGSSTHAILRYVQMLEAAGLVEIEMHGKDDPNPTIKLK